MSVQIIAQEEAYTIRIEGPEGAAAILSALQREQCGHAWRECLIDATNAVAEPSDMDDLGAFLQAIERTFAESITSAIRPIAFVLPDTTPTAKSVYAAFFNMMSNYFEWGIPDQHKLIRLFDSVREARLWIDQPLRPAL